MGGDVPLNPCAAGLGSGRSEEDGWKGRAQVSWEGAAVAVPLSAPGAGWVPTVLVPNLPWFPWVSVPPSSSSTDGCVCCERWWGAVSDLDCSGRTLPHGLQEGTVTLSVSTYGSAHWHALEKYFKVSIIRNQ